jgi:hypothetical protein
MERLLSHLKQLARILLLLLSLGSYRPSSELPSPQKSPSPDSPDLTYFSDLLQKTQLSHCTNGEDLDLRPIIERVGEQYELPLDLLWGIVQTESSGNHWATRYEPGFFNRYVKDRGHEVPRGVTRETEERLRATSFGPMQIMGQVARERGFDGVYLTQLCHPHLGIEWGAKHLKHFESRYFDSHGWDGVVSSYNQGSPRKREDGMYNNQGYVDKVNKAADTWG